MPFFLDYHRAGWPRGWHDPICSIDPGVPNNTGVLGNVQSTEIKIFSPLVQKASPRTEPTHYLGPAVHQDHSVICVWAPERPSRGPGRIRGGASEERSPQMRGDYGMLGELSALLFENPLWHELEVWSVRDSFRVLWRKKLHNSSISTHSILEMWRIYHPTMSFLWFWSKRATHQTGASEGTSWDKIHTKHIFSIERAAELWSSQNSPAMSPQQKMD